MPEFSVVKGNRDWFGREAILRNTIRNSLRKVFEKYGYIPLETPAIESQEALGFKGGGEIQKEVFKLTDQGGRSLALRFDQTVPLARFIASTPGMKFPVKRYAIGPVFRDGPTQPEQGRYRQFTQCDVDVLGIEGMVAEAELLALAQDAFEELGLGGVDVKINNRKLLDGILDYAGVPEHAKLRTISTLDKMDKLGLEGVREGLETLTLFDAETGLSNETFQELLSKYDAKGIAAVADLRKRIEAEVGEAGYREIVEGAEQAEDRTDFVTRIGNYTTSGERLLVKPVVDNLLGLVSVEGTNEETFARLANKIKTEKGQEGLREVRQLLDYSNELGFDFVRLDPSLARGLDYYTGTTLEVFLQDRDIVRSAILAGGRFDDMVGDFRGGEDIPAVGFSFGLERLAMILDKRETRETPTTLYLIPIGTTGECLRIAHQLRKQGVNVDMEMQDRKIGKAIGYASSMGIPYVGLVGEDELGKGEVTIKNLDSSVQSSVPIGSVGKYIEA